MNKNPLIIFGATVLIVLGGACSRAFPDYDSTGTNLLLATYLLTNSAPVITPATLTSPAGTTFQFKTSGGTAPYTYSVTSGSGSVSSTGAFTAPATDGNSVIRVTDGNDNTSDATATVRTFATQIQSETSLVGYWRLGESSGAVAVDAKSANNGTYVGTVTYSQTGSLANDADTAMQFDGTTAYVDTASSPFDPSTTDFSVGVWFKRENTALTDNQVLVSQLNGTGAGRQWLQIRKGGNEIGTNLGNSTTDSGIVVEPGTWYYAVLTRSGNSVKIYVDGALQVTKLRTTESATGNLRFGAGKLTDKFFRGVLDEVAVYNSALSADTVKSLYLLGLGKHLSISPAKVLVANNRTSAFVSSGGVAPYTYSIVSGSGSIDSGNGTFTAPSTGGTTTIRVTDANGNTSDAVARTVVFPDTVSGLALWFRADAITGAGWASKVSSWSDLSGSGNHAVQGTAVNQPEFKAGQLNGRPTIQFLGDDVLATPSVVIGIFTTFIVFKQDVATNAIIVEHGTDSNANAGHYLITSNNHTMHVNRGPGTTSSKNLSLNWGADGTYRIATQQFNGTHASHLLYVNGTLQTMTNPAGTGDPPGTATGSIFLGARSGVLFPMTGDIAEIIGFVSILSATELQGVECYLSIKYGIAVSHTCP